LNSYANIRGLLGIILGLGIGHLLRGIASMIENPKRYRPYWVHLLWCLFLFLYLLHFWWWEMHLDQVREWAFPLYFLVAIYATGAYLACAVLVPADLQGHEDYQRYFLARRRWFFALVIALLLLDLVDTRVKGSLYWHLMGHRYLAKEFAFVLLAALGIAFRNRRLQAVIAILAVVGETLFLLQYFLTVG